MPEESPAVPKESPLVPEASPLLKVDNVTKSFGDKIVTKVLHGIDLTIAEGEFTALMGPSGSGKSTLLNLLGLLDTPTSGTIHLNGTNTSVLGEDALTALRAEALGFVFQFHHLIGALTAIENLMMPLGIKHGGFTAAARKRAKEVLADVGLAGRETAMPSELSGGQQQRIAIARAIIHQPPLVLADEPTGNLDSETADAIFRLLREVNRTNRTGFVIVTHDRRLAECCDRIVTLVDGRISSDEART